MNLGMSMGTWCGCASRKTGVFVCANGRLGGGRWLTQQVCSVRFLVISYSYSSAFSGQLSEGMEEAFVVWRLLEELHVVPAGVCVIFRTTNVVWAQLRKGCCLAIFVLPSFVDSVARYLLYPVNCSCMSADQSRGW